MYATDKDWRNEEWVKLRLRGSRNGTQNIKRTRYTPIDFRNCSDTLIRWTEMEGELYAVALAHEDATKGGSEARRDGHPLPDTAVSLAALKFAVQRIARTLTALCSAYRHVLTSWSWSVTPGILSGTSNEGAKEEHDHLPWRMRFFFGSLWSPYRGGMAWMR